MEINSRRMSLPTLVSTLTNLQSSKRDYIVDAREMRVITSDTNKLLLSARPSSSMSSVFDSDLPFTQAGLDQLGERVSIPVPSKFLRALSAAHPAVAAGLLSTLLSASAGTAEDTQTNMVRCLSGQVRAVLSPKYRILDHYDILIQSLEVARAFNAFPVECSLTSSHMRVAFSTKEFFDTVAYTKHGGASEDALRSLAPQLKKMKDETGTVFPFIRITNSETGDGGLTISSGIWDPVCANGLIITRDMRAVHVGKQLDLGALSAEAIAADSNAVMLKARDLLRNAFSPDQFKKHCSRLQAAASQSILNPVQAVREVVSKADLPEAYVDSILSHFMQYDSTTFGLISAITRTAQDETDPSSAAALESFAATLLPA